MVFVSALTAVTATLALLSSTTAALVEIESRQTTSSSSGNFAFAIQGGRFDLNYLVVGRGPEEQPRSNGSRR